MSLWFTSTIGAGDIVIVCTVIACYLALRARLTILTRVLDEQDPNVFRAAGTSQPQTYKQEQEGAKK